MRNALQYQSTNGIQDLLDILFVSASISRIKLIIVRHYFCKLETNSLQDLQRKVHSPPRSDFDIVVTSGSQV